MSNTINVASKAPMAIQLEEPLADEFKDKPGEAPERKTVVLKGAGHPGMEVVTRGVDADVFKKWMDGNKHHPLVQNELLREVSDDEAEKLDHPEAVYGFEVVLEEAGKDSDNTKLAEKGAEHEEPKKSSELPEAKPVVHRDEAPVTHEEHSFETEHVEHKTAE